MTDYRTMAADLIDKEPVRDSDYSRETIMRRVLARTLESLDTERTRAEKAEQRERELRETVAKTFREIEHSMKQAAILGNDKMREIHLTTNIVQSALKVLIQPEPDPLVEEIEAMRQTAKELRECPNRDCNLVMQAIMWEKRAADVEARLSIVKGEPDPLVEKVADIIASRVSGPTVCSKDGEFKDAHRKDQIAAAKEIIAALSIVKGES